MRTAFALVATAASLMAGGLPQDKVIHVPLEYRAPVEGKPATNFSPKGTQVALTELPASDALPPGAVRPARKGTIPLGPRGTAGIQVLMTASPQCPPDLCRLYLDRNRNGNFADDGSAMSAAPAQNAKTRAWWTSINKVELSVPYDIGVVEPYLVNVWLVREDGAPAPELLRYSVGSWRQGTVSIDGVEALVAVMDGDNNAVFGKDDMWSAMAASEPNAATAVLSFTEARPTNRLMFLQDPAKTLVLEFRSLSADGRSMDVAVIDKGITKESDRAPDDMVRDERTRPRTTTDVVWGHGTPGLTAALAQAKASSKLVFLDFEATWCGPCHTMDEWIWTDAEVAARLGDRFVSVKIDVDLEKGLAKRYATKGYPTMMIVDATGKEVKRIEGYQSSKQMLEFLERQK